jgi:hypothetical protein
MPDILIAEEMKEALSKYRDPLSKEEGVKVGETVWWHGMGFLVTTLGRNGKFGFKNPYFSVSINRSCFKWSGDLRCWMAKIDHGVTPRRVNGKIIEPDLPRCGNCKAVTHRRRFCTNCCNDGAAKDYQLSNEFLTPIFPSLEVR